METTLMLKKAQARRRQGGFTLIELIAVIIILGILAAVITPKYFDMTERAQQSAYQGALAEAAARLNMSYAQYILETNVRPTTVANLTNATLLGGDTMPIDIGDYFVTYNAIGGTATTPTVAIDLRLKSAGSTSAIVRSQVVNWPR